MLPVCIHGVVIDHRDALCSVVNYNTAMCGASPGIEVDSTANAIYFLMDIQHDLHVSRHNITASMLHKCHTVYL